MYRVLVLELKCNLPISFLHSAIASGLASIIV